jgi:uncharacterized DUF497 family protein
VDIIWDDEKNKTLQKTRGISFEEIARLILQKKYLAILENPSRPDQMIFVLEYNEYTHIVPFVVDSDNNIVLKTAFPSRKFHRRFGRGHNENKT